MTTDTRDALLEKPSYILAMNVLQSDMYRTNMDARDAVDAILAEHAAATDALRTPRPEDARDAVRYRKLLAHDLVDEKALEDLIGRPFTDMGDMVDALTQPEAK